MSEATTRVVDYGATPLGGERPSRLFVGCVISIMATAFGFIVRAILLNDLGKRMNLTEEFKGAISGAGLFPFAISIILFSLFIDRIGYGVVMVFAFAGHVVGTALTILSIKSNSFAMLYGGTLILALANGAVEAVTNPVTATLYPTKKTHYLNILHSGWPAGLVLGGVFTILMASVDIELKLGLVLLPTLLYGALLIGQKFPVQERVAAGVSYRDMMKEFGAAGAFLVTWFLVMSLITVAKVFMQGVDLGAMENLLPPIVAFVVAAVFFGVYKSLGRPLFVFLLLIMILLATTELGVDSWVTDLMTPAFGKNAGWILVYTSAIMFVLRFCAGPIVHRLNPLGLLCICAAIAATGLLCLSLAGNTIMLVVLAATCYGVGKSFFWPTTLGVVAEQFPRGGALTLNAMGGMGMIAVGVLGGPFLGTLLDRNLETDLKSENPALHDRLYSIPANQYLMSYMASSPEQKELKGILEKLGGDKNSVDAAAKETGNTELQTAAATAVADMAEIRTKTLPDHYINSAAGLQKEVADSKETDATKLDALKKRASDAKAQLVAHMTGVGGAAAAAAPSFDSTLRTIAEGTGDKGTDEAKKKAANDARDALRANVTILSAEIDQDATAGSTVTNKTGEVKQGSLKLIALLPVTMFVCYLILVFYFKAKGGYKMEQLKMSGEKASGGIEGPMEA